MSDGSDDSLVNEFIQAATLWNSQGTADVKNANRTFDRLHILAKELRQTPSGRVGLANLISHDRVVVRLFAAAESLKFSPAIAVHALEAIEESAGPHSLSAEYTLRSYRAGTLNLDW